MNNMSNNLSKSWINYDEQVTNTIPTQPKTTKTSSKASKSDKPKRKQVKNACVNCQKACKKCDDGRPCARCIKLGLTETCRDSDRKERKKGVKRGPYKKRQAYIKDKPVYPKLTDDWKPNGSSLFDVSNTQLLNHQATWSPIVSPPLSSSCDADDEPYFLNSYAVNTTMHQPSLSPCSSSAESDEMLHFTYGFGYTNQNALSESYGMLDHQSLLGNAASPIESDLYSWDTPNAQMNMVEEMSPIGCDPISYPLQSYPLDTFQQSDDIFLPTDFQKLSSAQPDVFDMSLQSEIIPYWSTPIYQANPTNIMETPYTWSYSA